MTSGHLRALSVDFTFPTAKWTERLSTDAVPFPARESSIVQLRRPYLTTIPHTSRKISPPAWWTLNLPSKSHDIPPNRASHHPPTASPASILPHTDPWKASLIFPTHKEPHLLRRKPRLPTEFLSDHAPPPLPSPPTSPPFRLSLACQRVVIKVADILNWMVRRATGILRLLIKLRKPPRDCELTVMGVSYSNQSLRGAVLIVWLIDWLIHRWPRLPRLPYTA